MQTALLITAAVGLEGLLSGQAEAAYHNALMLALGCWVVVTMVRDV